MGKEIHRRFAEFLKIIGELLMGSDLVPRGQVSGGLMATVCGGLAPAAGGRRSQGFWELLNRRLFSSSCLIAWHFFIYLLKENVFESSPEDIFSLLILRESGKERGRPRETVM